MSSQTGYKNVIEIKGKYQARLQVKGDGRGGERKRKQHSLPGLFDTALEAALYLAFVKQEIMEVMCDENGMPRKQNISRTSSSRSVARRPRCRKIECT